MGAGDPQPPAIELKAEAIDHGMELYHEVCTFCHGIAAIGGAAIPDLRKMSEQTHRMFNEIVLEGVLADRGMSSFADRLSQKDVDDIYAFIVARSWQDYEAQETAKAGAEKPACWLSDPLSSLIWAAGQGRAVRGNRAAAALPPPQIRDGFHRRPVFACGRGLPARLLCS